MDTENDERMKLVQEINRLKLDLNQIQQEKSALELELHQKEEIILKAEAEAQNKEAQYKVDLLELRQSYSEASSSGHDDVKALQNELANMKKVEDSLREENATLATTLKNCRKELGDLEAAVVSKTEEIKAIQAEHDIAKSHLANLEFAFSDIHTKYERSKGTISGYASNEGALQEKLAKSNQTAIKLEERYDLLKAHARSQLDKAYKDILTLKEEHDAEVNKLRTQIKRLEIKVSSIQQSYEYKVKECTALADLCDEMTQSIPQTQ